MPNYDLNRLGDREFEHLCQSLLKKVIGNDTITFGEGRDGGREATFTGKAPYPSQSEIWDGNWIFQAKFHDIGRINPDTARQKVLQDLKSELDKIVDKYKRACDNYILITNVPLSSVSGQGTHDRITTKIIPAYQEHISHIRVWGADELYRFLDNFSDIRKAYIHFLVSGDLIAEMIDSHKNKSNELAQNVRLYIDETFRSEQFIQLDQAGGLDEDRLQLQEVFIDLDVQFRQDENTRNITYEDIFSSKRQNKISAMKLLLLGADELSKIVLIGGPGEGKSTLGQYLAQVHRATLLNKLNELTSQEEDIDLEPRTIRVPFRVILKDYAQWLIENHEGKDLEYYLCEQMHKVPGVEVSPKAIHRIFQENPCLLILDGLDEVTDQKLRTEMLDLITAFLERCDRVLLAKNLQVLATTRPNGYSYQFDPSQFVHLRLVKLEPAKIHKYMKKWIKAKRVDIIKAQRITESINEYLRDHQVRFLMDTPLQVTILILITYVGGTPPKQREALFNEYLEIIYKREKSKAKAIIKTERQLLFELHEYLGYVLHSRAVEAQDVDSTLKKPEFIKYVREFLKFKDPYASSKKLEKDVEQIVNDAHDRLVLIVSPQDNVFGFELRSIQEFFAAAHLTNAKSTVQRYDRFEAIARFSHWRNVSLFFSGRVGRSHSAEASNILEVCRNIDREKPDEFLRRGEMLSLELAIDRAFGPDQRLQRSAIEYGLTLVDVLPKSEKFREIKNLLEKLSKDDVRVHVLPTLKNRLSFLDIPYLESALNLYNTYAPSSKTVKETLDRFFHSTERQDILFAIRKSFEFEIDADWFKTHLGHHLVSLSFDDFVSCFGTSSLLNLNLTYKYLSVFNLKSDYIVEIAKWALENIFKIHTPISHVKRSNLLLVESQVSNPSISNDLMFCLLTIDCLILLTDGSLSIEDFSIYNGQLILMAQNFSRYHEIDNKRLTQNIDYLIQQQESVSSNLASLWEIVHWLTKISNSQLLNAEILNEFSNFYRSSRNVQPWIRKFLRNYLEQVIPYFYPMLKGIEEKPSSIVSSAYVFIVNESKKNTENLHVFLLGRFSKILISLSEGNNALLEREQVLAMIIFGSSKHLNELQKESLEIELMKEFGVSLEIVLAYFKEIWMMRGRKIELRDDIALVLLEDLITQIKADICDIEEYFYIISNLNSSSITYSDIIFRKFLELLLILAMRTESDEKAIDICAYLLLNLAEQRAIDDQSIISLLREVGKLGGSTQIQFYHEVVAIDKIEFLIRKLEKFLYFNEKEVVQGATILLSITMTNLIRNLEVKRDREFELYKISIGLEMALNKLESNNLIIKSIGIKMLIFAPKSLVNHWTKIIEAMLTSKTSEEIDAWISFITYIRIVGKHEFQNEWIEIFSKILECRTKLMPKVMVSALKKYNSLILSQSSGTFLNEKSLGLPLNSQQNEYSSEINE